MFIDFIEESFKSNQSKTAIIFNEKEYTYSSLEEKYRKCLNVLKSNNVTNSVVSFISDFSPESVALVLAIIESGNIFVPISFAVKEKKALVDISESQYILTLCDQDINIEKTGISPEHPLLKDLLKQGNPGLILFSSGTTGEPKGAVHDLKPLLDKYRRPGKSLRTITFLLFDHIGGFNTLFHMISNGGTIVIVNDRSASEVCRIIEKFQVELLPTTPTFLNMILFSKVYMKYDISCLKMITYGTEAMPEATLRALHNLFPGIKLKQTYGLSELGIMSSKSESSDSLFLKIGGEDYQTKIVDGILFIKSKTAMKGYLNFPSPFDEEGWFNTQDKVVKKGDYIRFLGRSTDIINVGGEKVYPAEVESILLDHPDVDDASVYGLEHSLMGQVVAAKITSHKVNDSNKKEILKSIREFCSSRLDKYKIPIKIQLINDESFASNRFKRTR